jgi:hypothetical protein
MGSLKIDPCIDEKWSKNCSKFLDLIFQNKYKYYLCSADGPCFANRAGFFTNISLYLPKLYQQRTKLRNLFKFYEGKIKLTTFF